MAHCHKSPRGVSLASGWNVLDRPVFNPHAAPPVVFAVDVDVRTLRVGDQQRPGIGPLNGDVFKGHGAPEHALTTDVLREPVTPSIDDPHRGIEVAERATVALANVGL